MLSKCIWEVVWTVISLYLQPTVGDTLSCCLQRSFTWLIDALSMYTLVLGIPIRLSYINLRPKLYSVKSYELKFKSPYTFALMVPTNYTFTILFSIHIHQFFFCHLTPHCIKSSKDRNDEVYKNIYRILNYLLYQSLFYELRFSPLIIRAHLVLCKAADTRYYQSCCQHW